MIYLDNAATTPCLDSVITKMLPYFDKKFGNPSSLHGLGINASMDIEDARDVIANSIGAKSNQIVFTSGATESNNMILKWFYNTYSNRCHIITSNIEHHSILNTLLGMSCDVTYIEVDKYGVVDPEEVRRAIKPTTRLVSIQMSNNEIPVRQKITYIGKICREHNIKFHTDATQSYLKHTIDVNAMNIDYLSVSGHKVGAPKGIGFLYTRSPITPMIRGGIQENGMRAGTENVPYIIGLAEAVNRWNNIDRHLHFYNLAYVAYNKLEEIDGVSFNGDFSSDSIISMTIENCDAMQLMICLDDCGVCVSTGSACSHGSPSHVLKAIGCKDIENTIRISFGLTTTIEEVETGMDIIIRCIKQIRGY